MMTMGSSGRPKPHFDVLLWLSAVPRSEDEFRALISIGTLCKYLSTIDSPKLSLALHIPQHLEWSMRSFRTVRSCSIGTIELGRRDALLRVAAEVDADLIIVDDAEAATDIVTSTVVSGISEALRQIEVFVRGFDVPWSFELEVFNQPWTAFYLACENSTFVPLMTSHSVIARESSAEAAEFARALIYNTLSNVLFTRDRFAFYRQQQRVAKRREWERQQFQFEIAYALNNFYLLTYSALDQLALVANAVLHLGLNDRQVAFSGKKFRSALAQQYPAIDLLMRSPDAVKLVELLEILRNHAAHRGTLVPTTIYNDFEAEPTEAELDAKAHELGYDRDLQLLPLGPIQERARELSRIKARIALSTVYADGVLVIDRDGQRYIVNPSPERDCATLIETLTSVLSHLANCGGCSRLKSPPTAALYLASA